MGKLFFHTSRHRQFVLFAAAGGTAAVVNFLSRIELSRWLAFGSAIVVAYICGMITAFILNRFFVFRNANNALHHQVLWFTIINMAAVLQTLAVSLALVKWIFPFMNFHWHPEACAHAIGVALPIFTSFFGHRQLSFSEKRT